MRQTMSVNEFSRYREMFNIPSLSRVGKICATELIEEAESELWFPVVGNDLSARS